MFPKAGKLHNFPGLHLVTVQYISQYLSLNLKAIQEQLAVQKLDLDQL